jgi:hypothetical protein
LSFAGPSGTSSNAKSSTPDSDSRGEPRCVMEPRTPTLSVRNRKGLEPSDESLRCISPRPVSASTTSSDPGLPSKASRAPAKPTRSTPLLHARFGKPQVAVWSDPVQVDHRARAPRSTAGGQRMGPTTRRLARELVRWCRPRRSNRIDSRRVAAAATAAARWLGRAGSLNRI